MSDHVTFAMDFSPFMAALNRIGDAAERRVKEASKISADNIQREARARVARATGQTADNILVTEAADGNGYIVHTTDVRLDAGQTVRSGSGKARLAPTYFNEKHVALYLEKGIHQGQPGSHTAPARPFFFSSALLEQGAHERRIIEAIQDAIDEEGLGN